MKIKITFLSVVAGFIALIIYAVKDFSRLRITSIRDIIIISILFLLIFIFIVILSTPAKELVMKHRSKQVEGKSDENKK